MSTDWPIATTNQMVRIPLREKESGGAAGGEMWLKYRGRLIPFPQLRQFLETTTQPTEGDKPTEDSFYSHSFKNPVLLTLAVAGCGGLGVLAMRMACEARKRDKTTSQRAFYALGAVVATGAAGAAAAASVAIVGGPAGALAVATFGVGGFVGAVTGCYQPGDSAGNKDVESGEMNPTEKANKGVTNAEGGNPMNSNKEVIQATTTASTDETERMLETTAEDYTAADKVANATMGQIVQIVIRRQISWVINGCYKKREAPPEPVVV